MEKMVEAEKQELSVKKVIDRLIDGISGIFLPLVNLLSASGIMTGLLAIAVSVGLIPNESGAYQVFHAMADSLFYFLPVLLAYTSAKKFGTNPFTAVVIAGILLYPTLTQSFIAEEAISFFQFTIRPVTYSSSVIPIIMAVGLLHYIERFFYKLFPDVVKGFFTPLFSIAVTSLITLFILGPAGSMIGDALAAGYETVYGLSSTIAGFILGGIVQIMVIFGFHWSLIPIAINNIALNGSDTILALMGPAVFAQAGAALAVFFKTKQKEFKPLCISAAISALFGITEPATYGVNLPLKIPMIGVCLGGAVGGGIAGFAGSSAMSFAFPGLVTLPVFMGDGFLGYLISILIGFIVSFSFTMISKFEAIQTVKEDS